MDFVMSKGKKLNRASDMFHRHFDIKVWRSASGWNFDVNILWAACESCNATWNLNTDTIFPTGMRKTTKSLHRSGRLQDVSDAKWLLASSPIFKNKNCNIIPYLGCYFGSERQQTFLRIFVQFGSVYAYSISQSLLNFFRPRTTNCVDFLRRTS
jgi:hypothetical protein